MLRCLAGVAVLVAGICTTAMNWRFSYQLGASTWDAYTWAIFSVALDVSKWLILPCATSAWPRHKLRALAAVGIWLIATIYSFSAAVGFAALNRDHTRAERHQQAELNKTLETMRLSPRWQSSAACADATTVQSKEFCASYRATAAKLNGSSSEPDPQAAVVANMTGLSIGTVRIALALFLATACEVISALGFFAIWAPPARDDNPRSQSPTASWQPPAWQVTPSRDTPRRVATWLGTSRPKEKTPGS